MYVDELARFVNWSGVGTNPNWAEIESRGSIKFPRDYKEYAARFPIGSFRTFMTICPPVGADIGNSTENVIDDLNFVRDDIGAYSMRARFPFSLYPDPGGLFPWGLIEQDFVICWDTRGANPDNWPVVMLDNMFTAYWEHSGPMTKFVLDFCRGTTGIDELGYIDDAPVCFDEIDLD